MNEPALITSAQRGDVNFGRNECSIEGNIGLDDNEVNLPSHRRSIINDSGL
jgi:hypothetical protein